MAGAGQPRPVESLPFRIVDHGSTRRRVAQSAALGALLIIGGVLAGCGSRVAGSPIGQAGFGDVPQAGSTANTTGVAASTSVGSFSANTGGVHIATPRKASSPDTCTLLTQEDLQRIGGAVGGPRRNEVLPESCKYALAGGAPDDSIVVGFFKPFAQARKQQPKGWLDSTGGDDTWLNCQSDNGYETCGATIAVQPDRTLVAILSQRDTSQDTVVTHLHEVAVAAFQRLQVS